MIIYFMFATVRRDIFTDISVNVSLLYAFWQMAAGCITIIITTIITIIIWEYVLYALEIISYRIWNGCYYTCLCAVEQLQKKNVCLKWSLFRMRIERVCVIRIYFGIYSDLEINLSSKPSEQAIFFFIIFCLRIALNRICTNWMRCPFFGFDIKFVSVAQQSIRNIFEYATRNIYKK